MCSLCEHSLTLEVKIRYVHYMNNSEKNPPINETDDIRSLKLLDEISKNETVTQRELKSHLGVSLGLVNSYIKNLVSKGYITVSQIPKRRYAYYLTPKGFTEKTRLTVDHLRNFTSVYKVARRDFTELFLKIEKTNIKKVCFCGIDEITEIAFLSLNETDLELVGVVDLKENVLASNKKNFFGTTITTIEGDGKVEADLFIITSFNESKEITEALTVSGIDKDNIYDISGEGWLEKIENLSKAS